MADKEDAADADGGDEPSSVAHAVPLAAVVVVVVAAFHPPEEEGERAKVEVDVEAVQPAPVVVTVSLLLTEREN